MKRVIFMKYLKFTFIVLFNLIINSSYSQGEFVVEIDRTTGHITKTGLPVQPGIIYVYPNWRVINENSGIYIFPIGSPSSLLLSYDFSNGSVINSPLYNSMLGELEFSNSLNTLYGLFSDWTYNVKYFVSINPITCDTAIIGNPIPTGNKFQGKSTFDQINNKYIFINHPDTLYSIDATNGNVISKPVLNLLSNSQMLCEIAFDDSTNILYGLLYDNNNYFLCSINPSTGDVTKIGTGSTLLNCGSAAIDAKNNQFMCIYFASDDYHITTFDLVTGNIVYDKIINPLPDPIDNVLSLKYDNTREKLFSIHWDNNFEDTIGFEELFQEHVAFFPNPIIDNLTINVSQKCTIEILNTQGQIIKTINSNGTMITIDIADFSSGVYILKATTDIGVVLRKLVKQ